MSEASAYKKAPVGKAFQMIQALREAHSDMQIETAQLFMLIAMNPGITMRELRDLSEQPQGKVSRNVALLSEWRTAEEPGLGWVTSQIDPNERRRKVLDLTQQGSDMAKRLIALVS
ncbi:MarR family winged helix-turn-helix transcriptional regulator [Chromohalobacter israelensis]|uniref:MarR family winged helix-turn-helix transcriptional regulator n=1 Tax=Chromohalobacter israelensis TaxID=141390 RepID=UPI000FFE7F23|nr:MarR family winged helix-turn-helix transcriptional regulator [Chromohalobacter salexigens]RXE48376.1 hypothetical protein B4O83_10475 [Chromohalobacter salexigens]